LGIKADDTARGGDGSASKPEISGHEMGDLSENRSEEKFPNVKARLLSREVSNKHQNRGKEGMAIYAEDGNAKAQKTVGGSKGATPYITRAGEGGRDIDG